MIRNFIKRMQCLILLTGSVLLLVGTAEADDYTLTLKDHKFTPENMVVPANQKVKLTVKNDSTSPAEFESSDLDREKIVSPGNEIAIFIGPLSPGNYGYFDDFHRETTGTLIAK